MIFQPLGFSNGGYINPPIVLMVGKDSQGACIHWNPSESETPRRHSFWKFHLSQKPMSSIPISETPSRGCINYPPASEGRGFTFTNSTNLW